MLLALKSLRRVGPAFLVPQFLLVMKGFVKNARPWTRRKHTGQRPAFLRLIKRLATELSND
jgi:hypothetical protein